MHRARIENSSYFSMLENLSMVAEDAVVPPISDEELATWQAQPLSVADTHAVRHAQAVAYRSRQPGQLLGPREQALLNAKQFNTFTSNASTHSFIKDGLQRDLTEVGMPDAFRTTDVLAYVEDGYSHFLPVFERAVAYQGTLRIITARLNAETCQLNAALVLGDDTQLELLTRVHDRDYGKLPKRAAMDTFVEGYDSIAFAGAHLELGGAVFGDSLDRFARSVTGYAAIVPGSGALAPMAMRGEYFRDFADISGRITEPYRATFAAQRQRQAANDKRKPVIDGELHTLCAGPPYNPEYCNAVGFPPKPTEFYIPEYQDEGCGGLLNQVVYKSARLFGAKVIELERVTPPDVVALDFTAYIEAYQAAMRQIL